MKTNCSNLLAIFQEFPLAIFSGALPQTKPPTKHFKSIGFGSPHLSLWQWHCNISIRMLHFHGSTRLRHDRCSVREERVRRWKNSKTLFKLFGPFRGILFCHFSGALPHTKPGRFETYRLSIFTCASHGGRQLALQQ